MTASDLREMIQDALYMDDAANEAVANVASFNEAGVMTYNEGLVVRMQDGSEFQLSIVQSA